MVSDGEVGALAGQAETKGGGLVVFIRGSQCSYHLRRDLKGQIRGHKVLSRYMQLAFYLCEHKNH